MKTPLPHYAYCLQPADLHTSCDNMSLLSLSIIMLSADWKSSFLRFSAPTPHPQPSLQAASGSPPVQAKSSKSHTPFFLDSISGLPYKIAYNGMVSWVSTATNTALNSLEQMGRVILYGDIEQRSYECVVQSQQAANGTLDHVYFRNYSEKPPCPKSSIIIKTH